MLARKVLMLLWLNDHVCNPS